MRDELQRGVDDGHTFLRTALDQLSADYDESKAIDVVTVENTEEQAFELVEELDPGEVYALAATIDIGGALATDDLDARDIAEERNVPFVRSIGVLARGIRRRSSVGDC